MRGFSGARHIMGSGGRHKRGVSRHKTTSKVQKRKKAKMTVKIKGSVPQVISAMKKVAAAPEEAAPKEEGSHQS